MDASKAVESIRRGDWFGLVDALDKDREFTFTLNDGALRSTSVVIGQTFVNVSTDPNYPTQPDITIAICPSPEEALSALDAGIAQAQIRREIMLQDGAPSDALPRFYVDGVERPMPGLVTVPDDASGLDNMD